MLIDPATFRRKSGRCWTLPERYARGPGSTMTGRSISGSPADTASMSSQMQQRPRGNSMAKAMATWRVCLGAESERFGTTFLPKTTT